MDIYMLFVFVVVCVLAGTPQHCGTETGHGPDAATTGVSGGGCHRALLSPCYRAAWLT